jgi:hypothetical protein
MKNKAPFFIASRQLSEVLDLAHRSSPILWQRKPFYRAWP